MNIEEIATKADLAEMEQRIIQALSAQKVEKERCLDIGEAAKYIKAKKGAAQCISSQAPANSPIAK